MGWMRAGCGCWSARFSSIVAGVSAVVVVVVVVVAAAAVISWSPLGCDGKSGGCSEFWF